MDACIAWSGDYIERLTGDKALHDDVEGLRKLTNRVDAGNAVVKSWVELVGGAMISVAGGEGRATVPAAKLADLARIREQVATAYESPVSVGVGMKLGEAERALKVTKLQGGNQIRFYSPQVDEELARAREQENPEDKLVVLGKKEGESRQVKWLRERAAEGFCSRCGARKATDGEQCSSCATGKRERYQDNRNEGLCSCGRARAKGKKSCQRCIDNSTLSKAGPAMNAGQGGGFSGAHPAQNAAAPVAPSPEASEHSETESFLSMLNDPDRPQAPEGTHAAGDLEDHFHSLAQQQGVKDDQDRQVSEANLDKIKGQVAQALQAFRAQMPAMEQIKQGNPELYQSMVGLVQAVVTLGREITTDGQGESVKKSEGVGSNGVEDLDFEPLEKALPRAAALPRTAAKPLYLVHFGKISGLKAVDLKHMGEGAPSQEYRQGIPKTRRAYYYVEGGRPEPMVVGGSRSKYVGVLPASHQIYDLAEDPAGIVPKARKAFMSGKGAESPSETILVHVKRAGYCGYRNTASQLPHVVALFHDLPVVEVPMDGTTKVPESVRGKLTVPQDHAAPTRKDELTIDDMKRELEAQDKLPKGNVLDKDELGDPDHDFQEVRPEEFETLISKHPRQGSLDQKRDYTNKRTFLNRSRTAGYVLGNDRYMGNLFSTKKGLGAAAVAHALRGGPVYGNAFEGGLTDYYKKLGFTEFRREKNWDSGGPDVVHLQLGGHPIAKAALPMPTPKGPGTPRVETPIGGSLSPRRSGAADSPRAATSVKVQHADGTTSVKEVLAGMIRSQDPTGHPTSSREPNAR